MTSRSFRFRRPRGGFCQRGYCRQCVCRLAGGPDVLACQSAAGRLAPPSSVGGFARVLGWLAERMTPWFWERPVLPAFLGDHAIEIMRRCTNAAVLPPFPPEYVSKPRVRIRSDVLVVGGGLSGTTAAVEFTRAGHSVTLVHDAEIGGTCAYVPSLRAALVQARSALSGVNVLEHTTLIGLYPEGPGGVAVGTEKLVDLGFETLVVATGAHDRTLLFRNNDIPGIIGMRAYEKLLFEGAIPVAGRIGVFAGAREASRILAVSSEWGRTPAWIAGPGELPQTRVDAFPDTTIVAANGSRKLRSVVLRPGGSLSCSLLVLGFSQPDYTLQRQAGMSVRAVGEPPVIVAAGAATTPTLAVGEAAGWYAHCEKIEAVRDAVRSFIAGHPVAAREPEQLPRAPAANDDRAFVCFCEDVRLGDIREAIARGFTDMELLKRRTGAGTGPCQGRMCFPNMIACARSMGLRVDLPTGRPPTRPLPLSFYCTHDDGRGSRDGG